MHESNSSVTAVLAEYPSIAAWQEELYRGLHAAPELGHQEHETAALVARELREFGWDVTEGIGSTGVVGVLRSGAGPVVLMRADMDALPVAEETGLPYASTRRALDGNGAEVPVMHACGHDVHTACLLGAAHLLADSRGSWRGTAVALFQPAEELADGARTMIDGGLADVIPRPDVALAQHVLALPAGHVGTRSGAILSSGDSLRVTVWGRGSHGSMPQLSIDPVVLASSIVMRLQGIVSREVAPGEFAVVTVGRIEVGSKSNVISDRAVLELNVRTFSDDTRSRILAAVRRIVTAECAASGSPKPPDFELYDHYPVTDNDADATARVAAAFEDHFGERAFGIDRQSASEDFSEVPTAFGAPYTYWGIGGIDPTRYAAAEAAGTLPEIPANHSPEFAPVIQPTLSTGTEAMVVAALAWLGAPG